MGKVVYKSNGGAIGDGFRQARISAGGQKLEIMTDTKAGTYSEVILVADVVTPPPTPIDPPPGPIDPPPVVPPVGVAGITPAQFASVLASAKGGDTLILSAGIYTMPTAPKFATPVTIIGGTFQRLALNGAENIIFSGVIFDYTFIAPASLQFEPFAVTNSKGITFHGCTFDGDKSSGVSAIDDKFATGRGLAISASQNITVHDCEFKIWMRGLVVSRSSQIRVINNDVSGIRSDGMNFIQVQGVLIEGNRLHDFASAPGSGDHADMIQFWTTGTTAPSTYITIRSNTFDVAQGTWAQSLFMRNEVVDKAFSALDEAAARAVLEDMAYRNVVIEGNFIKNTHIHGITLGETIGAVVQNNTLTKAPLNLALKYNADYVAKYGADAGIMQPKINMAAASTGVVLSGNTVDGVAA